MLKIVVFDSGWGGEMFADYVEEKVPVVEVKRVIDWRNAPYSAKGRTDICVMTENALRPYIGEADVIVIASYAATVAAMDYLKWKYPEQKFVGFDTNLSDYVVRKKGMRNIMVLATGVVEQSISFQRDLFEMSGLTILRPNCDEWIQLVDDGEMTIHKLKRELADYLGMGLDAVLLYSTGFVDLKPMLEKIYGKGVVIDDFARVFRKMCVALGLRGGDVTRVKDLEQRRVINVTLTGRA